MIVFEIIYMIALMAVLFFVLGRFGSSFKSFWTNYIWGEKGA